MLEDPAASSTSLIAQVHEYLEHSRRVPGERALGGAQNPNSIQFNLCLLLVFVFVFVVRCSCSCSCSFSLSLSCRVIRLSVAELRASFSGTQQCAQTMALITFYPVCSSESRRSGVRFSKNALCMCMLPLHRALVPAPYQQCTGSQGRGHRGPGGHPNRRPRS